MSSNEIRQWMGTARISQLADASKPPYQAPLQPVRVRLIAKSYDPAKLGVFEVRIKDDGSWELLDGQHRTNAAMSIGRGEDVVNVLFTAGIDQRTAAALFVGINERRMKPRGAILLAMAHAGDPIPTKMVEIVESHGFTVDMVRDSTRNDGAINCSETLVNLIKRNGERHVDTVLLVIRSAWNGERESLTRDVIEAVSQFLLVYPEINTNELANRLQATTPKRLRAEIASARVTERGSSLLSVGYARGRGVLQIWNHGRRSARLEDRFNDYDFRLRSERMTRNMAAD